MLGNIFPDIEFDEAVGIESDFSTIVEHFHDEEKVRSWNNHVKTWNLTDNNSKGTSQWTWLVVNTIIFKVNSHYDSGNNKCFTNLVLDKGPWWLTRLEFTFIVEEKIGYISLSLHGKIGIRPFFIKRWMAAVMRRQLSQTLEQLKNKVEKHQTLS